jgi:hypothetical protein
MPNETGAQTPAADSAGARPIGWWLKEADARLDTAFEQALEGFPTDRRGWQVLSSLARRPSDEADLVEVLAAFDPPPVVHEVLVQLKARGWVTDIGGGLQLTDEGARQHAVFASAVDQVRQRVGAALPREDYMTLVRLLQRLTEAL